MLAPAGQGLEQRQRAVELAARFVKQRQAAAGGARGVGLGPLPEHALVTLRGLVRAPQLLQDPGTGEQRARNARVLGALALEPFVDGQRPLRVSRVAGLRGAVEVRRDRVGLA